ncbi:MAG: hypothetical protein AAFX81_17840 [Pseudomonadota bacterium]
MRADDPVYRRRLRRKNLAVASLLTALVVLFFLISIVKMRGG